MPDNQVESGSAAAFFTRSIVESDKDVAQAIHAEIQRQQQQIELMPRRILSPVRSWRPRARR